MKMGPLNRQPLSVVLVWGLSAGSTDAEWCKSLPVPDLEALKVRKKNSLFAQNPLFRAYS
jgi:hypothetical protein